MTHWREFDHVIINDDFATALAELRGIVSGQAMPIDVARVELLGASLTLGSET